MAMLLRNGYIISALFGIQALGIALFAVHYTTTIRPRRNYIDPVKQATTIDE